MQELNDSLESAAFEIIANPSLIGTEQWQHAVQLFRTKSLDSLVRYFSSYLPPDHPWYKDSASSSEVGSSVDSFAPSHGSLFGDDDGLILNMTDEPLEFSSSLDLEPVLPPSPRSMTMCSDSSVASPIDDVDHDYDLNTPSRTLSYSESEPDCCELSDSVPRSHHGESSTPESIDMLSPTTSFSSNPREENGDVEVKPTAFGDHAGKPAQSFVVDSADMATPKPEGQVFFERKAASFDRRHRSLSPPRSHPLADYEVDDLIHRDPRSAVQCMGMSRRKRDFSPVQRKRKVPAGSLTRIQKPSTDTSRSRTRGRRCCEN